MKRFTLLACGLLSVVLCSAQLNKGRVLLGGAVNFGSGTTSTSASGTIASKYKTSNIGIDPFAGLFVRNNLLAGVSFSYRHNKSTNSTGSSEQEASSDQYGGGLILRRYFPLGSNFFFYVNGGLSYLHGKTTFTSPNVPTETSPVFDQGSLSLYPGVAFAVGKRVVLETSLSNLFSLNYTSARSGNGPFEYKQSSFSGGIGAGGSLPLNIGFNILLGK